MPENAESLSSGNSLEEIIHSGQGLSDNPTASVDEITTAENAHSEKESPGLALIEERSSSLEIEKTTIGTSENRAPNHDENSFVEIGLAEKEIAEKTPAARSENPDSEIDQTDDSEMTGRTITFYVDRESGEVAQLRGIKIRVWEFPVRNGEN
jgi:hypothetical protein